MLCELESGALHKRARDPRFMRPIIKAIRIREMTIANASRGMVGNGGTVQIMFCIALSLLRLG
jgi:hypothetical protein